LAFIFLSHFMMAQKGKLWRSEASQQFSNYEQLTIFHDKNKRFATVKIIDKVGVLRSETNFKDELKHGFEKVFYTDGSLYWKSDYRSDIANGIFMVYYPDGSLKRKEKYRNGYKKEGFCYDTLGSISTYYPFKTEPIFGEGAYSIQRYFRDKWPSSLKSDISGWTMLEMNLLIGKDSLARISHFKIESLEYQHILLNAVQNMPKWKPGTFDGQVNVTAYKVSLILTSDGLYLSELMRPQGNPLNSPIMRNGNNGRRF